MNIKSTDLSAAPIEFTGIILSGGKSSRMGRDKASIKIGNKLLIEIIIETLTAICSEVLISSNNKSLRNFGFQVIEDEISGCGPISGIYSCLKKSSCDWNFIISVDSPFVTPEFIQFLASGSLGYDCVIPAHKNGIEPLIGFYHKRVIPIFSERISKGNFKMNRLIADLNANIIRIDNWIDTNPKIVCNINSPEDLHKLT